MLQQLCNEQFNAVLLFFESAFDFLANDLQATAQILP